jgi:hypothetical protein
MHDPWLWVSALFFFYSMWLKLQLWLAQLPMEDEL